MKKHTTIICISSIATVVVLYSVFILKNGYLLFVDDLIFPLIGVFFCVVIFCLKNIQKNIKTVISICITLAVVSKIFLLFAIGDNIHFSTYYEDEAKKFYEYEEDITFDYKECIAYVYETHSLFKQKAKTVIFKFGDNFDSVKKSIEEKYEFYSEPVMPHEPTPYFDFLGYEFKLRCIEKVYPKVLFFIGVNDKNKEVVYVYFGSEDLDTVLSYEDILQFYCGWQYISLQDKGVIWQNIVFYR